MVKAFSDRLNLKIGFGVKWPNSHIYCVENSRKIATRIALVWKLTHQNEI